jgi:hypothetical protein
MILRYPLGNLYSWVCIETRIQKKSMKEALEVRKRMESNPIKRVERIRVIQLSKENAEEAQCTC